MKKLYRPLCFVAAVAAMTLTSCQKENFNPAGDGETVTITVHANVEDVANATKTHIEGTQVLWDENEEMKVITFNNADPDNTGSESNSTEFTPSADFTTATFKATVDESNSPDRIAGVYPADAAKGLESDTKASAYKVELKANQSATATSYDPSTYIMIARADNYPLENNEWTAYYKRATALNQMILSGITDDIKSVTITFPEGQQAAGRRYFNLATGEAGEIYHEPTNVVTVNYATPLKAGNGENDVWFTSWNVNVKTGEAITVKAESATKIYTKTLTATKEVALMENYLNIFPFDMTGAEVENATEATGDGTLENPYNVAAALDLIATSGGTESEVYVKGFITEIDEVSTSYGNATYFISDDKEGSNRIEVFRGKYLEESNFTSEDQIAVGDEVIVVGGLENYNGTYEISQNNYIYSHNGKTELDGPSAGSPGSVERPYTVAEAFEAITTSGITQKVYVEGTISSIAEVSTQQYGNATYDISDDGSTQGDQLTVFRGYYLNNERFTSVDQINVGDKVIVFGNLVNYNGTYEFNSGNYIYSLNGSASQPELSVSSKAVTVSADETEVVFEYTARNLTGDVSATVASDESQIISGSPVVDAVASTVTVTLNPNTDKVEKTATITLSAPAADNVDDITLTVTQRASGAVATEVIEEIFMDQVFSASEELDESKTYTWGIFSVTFEKNNTSNTNYNSGDPGVRFYQDDILKFDAGNKTILKMEFSSYDSKNGPISADSGNVSNLTWTGETSSVAITAKKQLRFNKITVTYRQ